MSKEDEEWLRKMLDSWRSEGESGRRDTLKRVLPLVVQFDGVGVLTKLVQDAIVAAESL